MYQAVKFKSHLDLLGPRFADSGLCTESFLAARGLNNRYNYNRHLDFNYLIIKAFNFDYII